MQNSVRNISIYVLLLFSCNSYAISQWKTGYIERIYIDTSDVVIKIGQENSGPCGSNLYHIQRSSQNFKEYYEMVLVAVGNRKSIGIKTVECDGSRNITSVAYINKN